MNKVVRVSFKQVYDLVFRARSSKLNSVAYVLDFYDWIKAGIAFNTRGFQLGTRKISYFVKLYDVLQLCKTDGPEVLEGKRKMFEEALSFYYDDIYEIYQDHLRSKHEEAAQRQSRSVPDFGELLILPCFDGTPVMREVFERRVYLWNEYTCKRRNDFIEDVSTVYLNSDSSLFKCMSMMYDYGRGCVERGVLLEVKLWDSQT